MFFNKKTGRRTKLFFALILVITPVAPTQVAAADLQDPMNAGASTSLDASIIGNKAILSLKDVLKLALKKNPQLSSARSEIVVRRAQAQQASQFLNPSLSVQLENVGVSDAAFPDEGLEATLFLKQVIELGSKRGHRRSVYGSRIRGAEAEMELARLQVIADTTVAFVEALAQQHALGVAEEKTRLAEDLLTAVRLLVRKGAISGAEIPRAEVEVLLQKSETRRKGRALRESFVRLATMWGAEDFTYSRLRGNLAIHGEVPSWPKLAEMLERSPQQKRWDLEIDRSRAAVKLEDARRIPNIQLGIGPKYFDSNDEWGLQVGVSMDLPIFNRNQGARQESLALLARAHEEQEDSQLELRRRLSLFREAMLMSYDEARALEEEILPRAREAYDDIRRGHLEGAFELTAVLDAQRSLFVLQSRLLEAQRSYRVAQARSEQLVGESILTESGD